MLALLMQDGALVCARGVNSADTADDDFDIGHWPLLGHRTGDPEDIVRTWLLVVRGYVPAGYSAAGDLELYGVQP